jgi:hypothetical protein
MKFTRRKIIEEEEGKKITEKEKHEREPLIRFGYFPVAIFSTARYAGLTCYTKPYLSAPRPTV